MRLTTASYVMFPHEGFGSQLTFTGSLQSTAFEIDQEYVGRVVGSGGAQINKIRDSLGVAIYFDQEPDPHSFKEASKKKKEKAAQKSRVKVGTRGLLYKARWLTLVTDYWP